MGDADNSGNGSDSHISGWTERVKFCWNRFRSGASPRLNPWPVNWEPFMQPGAVPDTQPDMIFSALKMPSPDTSPSHPTSQNLANWHSLNELSRSMGSLMEPMLEQLLVKK